MAMLSSIVLFTYFWNAVAGGYGYGRGYSEKNYDISLKTISFDDYGAECSVAYISTTLSSVDSVWFVNGVPILYDDADWLVEENSKTQFTSTLKSRRKLRSSEVENKAIYVNFYSSGCKTTVDFGSKRKFIRAEYKVSINYDFLYISPRTNSLTGAKEFSTSTAITIKSTRTKKVEKKMQWEIVLLSNGYEKYAQNLPIQESSRTKWKYFGPSNAFIFARLQFSAVVKGDFYDPFIALKYVRDVKLFSNRNLYSTPSIPITYIPGDTVFKSLNKDTRLYTCFILEVVPISRRSYMYLQSNSTATRTDLRFFPYKYVHYGYQTELYSIVRGPAHLSDEAYCKAASKGPPGYNITKA